MGIHNILMLWLIETTNEWKFTYLKKYYTIQLYAQVQIYMYQNMQVKIDMTIWSNNISIVPFKSHKDDIHPFI